MKKLLFFMLLLPLLALGQNRPIVIGDPSQPNTVKKSQININTNTLETTFPGTVGVTNGQLKVSGSGTINFPSNSVAGLMVAGVTNSAGAADAGKIPKLGANGLLDTSIVPTVSVVSTAATNGPISYMRTRLESSVLGWEEIMRITNNQAVGDLLLPWKVQYNDQSNTQLALHVAVRVLECPLSLATTNVIDGAFFDAGGAGVVPASVPLSGAPLRLGVSTNVYILQGAISANGAGEGWANYGTAASGGNSVDVTNCTYMVPIRVVSSALTVTGGGGGGGTGNAATGAVYQTWLTTGTNAFGVITATSAAFSGGFTSGTATFGPTYVYGATFVSNYLSGDFNFTGFKGTNGADAVAQTDFVTKRQLANANSYTNANAATLFQAGTYVPSANLGTGTPNNTTFLSGDGTYKVPAGNGGSSLPVVGTFQRASVRSETNGQTYALYNDAPWKQVPNWERLIDNIWQTQATAAFIPVITTNYAGAGVSTIPSAKVYYATNNFNPWFQFWGNVSKAVPSHAAYLTGTFPNSSSGGGFIIRSRTAEITNEWQFWSVNSAQTVIEPWVEGQSLGTVYLLPQNTNVNFKLVFPSYRARDVAFLVSGYDTAPGFGYAFCNAGGSFSPSRVRDDGTHFVIGDSGIAGFGNGGDVGVTNSTAGFLGKLMMVTGQEWINDSKHGTGFLAGGTDRYYDRLTNDVQVAINAGKRIDSIWAMGGGSDNPSNSASIYTGITNFYITANNLFPSIERYCQIYWDYSPTGVDPNFTTNEIAATAALGVPSINLAPYIDSTMFSSSFYIFQSGPFAGHPTTAGHQQLTDNFIQILMTQTNSYRSRDR